MRILPLFIPVCCMSASLVFCNTSGSQQKNIVATDTYKESLGTIWQPVGLNEDESVSAFQSCKKGRLVAGTSAGIMLSDDKGATWKTATIDPANKSAVFSLTMDAGGVIYAGLSKYGVLVSADNGNSWKMNNTGLNQGGPRNTMAILATGPVIIKGTYESGAYLSTDKGQSWAPCNSGIPLDLLTNKMVSVSQLTQNKDAVYALTSLGIRYSTDKGKNWIKPLHNGIERLGYMSSLAAGSKMLYAGVTRGSKGLFISSDNGNNWKAAGLQDKEPNALFVAPDGTLYAGCKGEVYRTADNGITWTLIGSGLPASDVYSISITPDNKLIAGLNRKGIWLLK